MLASRRVSKGGIAPRIPNKLTLQLDGRPSACRFHRLPGTAERQSSPENSHLRGITGRANRATHRPPAAPAKPHLNRIGKIFPKQIRYLASPWVALHEARAGPVRPHLIHGCAFADALTCESSPPPANTHLWQIQMVSERSHHAVPAHVSREVATNFTRIRISTEYRNPEKPHHRERRNRDFTEARCGDCRSRKTSPQCNFERSRGWGLATIAARARGQVPRKLTFGLHMRQKGRVFPERLTYRARFVPQPLTHPLPAAKMTMNLAVLTGPEKSHLRSIG